MELELSTEPFPLVSVNGFAYERGRQHGAVASERIRKGALGYHASLQEAGCSENDKKQIVKDILAEIATFDADYAEEIKGIADGAGVAVDDVVLINARTEAMARAKRRNEDGGPSDIESDGCTGAVILPERSSTGRLLHGQNWDWRAECAETSIVLRVRRDDGPDVLTFTEAGSLARSGLNSCGIAITANHLDSDRDYKGSGIPLPLIRRKALEQEHFALAMKIVAATPKVGSNNMIVSTAAGYAVDFECAPDEFFPLYPENGLLVHANHWVSDAAIAKVRDTGRPSGLDSYYRDRRVRSIIEKAPGSLSLDDLKRAFFDDFGTPYAVCRPPRSSLSGNLTATVAMIVMEPSLGVMEVAPLPAINRVFTRYALDREPELLSEFR